MEENQKISRIIEQFSLYLLDNAIDNFTFKIKKTRKLTSLLFECDKPDEEMLQEINNTFKLERRSELETYGWELIGQGNADSELSLLGMLVNYFTYYLRDGNVYFNLVRYED